MGANAATFSPADRSPGDFYATPQSAIDQLLDVERFDGPVWEPACGHGAISQILVARGYQVISTDLVDRGFGIGGVDFLLEHKLLAPQVMTNPPFNLATEFARHALALGATKLALLLKVGFLEGPTKADLHSRLSRVWVIRRRVTFLKNGQSFSRSNGKGGIHTYAWFVWDQAHSGPVTIDWLEGEPCK